MATPVDNLPVWSPSSDGADLLALETSAGVAAQMSLADYDRKRTGIFNVLDYGADTGAADNSVAFQAAIDACANNSGGIVWVPPIGGFSFTSGIQMHGRGVRLVGACGVGQISGNQGLAFNTTGPCIRIGSNGDGRYLTGGGIENLRLNQGSSSATEGHVICFGEHSAHAPAGGQSSPSGSRCRFLNLRIGSQSKNCAAVFCNNGNMTENLFQNFDFYHAPGSKDGISLIHLEGHDVPNTNHFTNGRMTDSRNYAIWLKAQTSSKPTSNMFTNIDIENGAGGGVYVGGAIGTTIQNVNLFDTSVMEQDFITVDLGYQGGGAAAANTTILNCVNQNIVQTWPGGKYYINLKSSDSFVAGCGQPWNATITTEIYASSGSRSHIFDNPTCTVINDAPTSTVVYSNWGVDGSYINYDNTTSGMTATKMQAAMDELEARVQALEL